MKLTFATACIMTGLAVSLGAFRSSSPQRVPDRFLRLTVQLDVAEVVYRTGDAEDSGSVFYDGEPVRARFVLWNNTPENLILRRDSGEWFRAGSLTTELRRGSEGAVSAVLSIRNRKSERARMSERELDLTPGGSDVVTVNVLGSSQEALRPGVYHLKAQLDRAAIAPSHFDRYRNVLSWESRFVVRAVQSTIDEMNYYHHMAMRCSVDGDLAASRAWLERLLRINPVSIVAYAELGALARRSGNCGEARQHWTRALELLRSNADTEDWTAGVSGAREERSAAIERHVARCK